MMVSRRMTGRWLVRGMVMAWLAAGLSGCARTAAAKESLGRRGIEVHDGRAMRVFRV